MNVEKFTEEIKRDEGVKYEVYLDHLGLPTCGIGHLIKEDDPEHGLEVGTEIGEERVNELFAKDLETTIDECKKLYYDFDVLPVKAQHIIANMMFNMGRPRLSRFHKMKRAVDNREWQEAATQMLDSRWANQVPNRANRLIQEMKSINT